MTEPRRLLDTATGLDRAILESVVDDEPSPERRQRVVAAIGAASVGAGSAAVALKAIDAAVRWKIVVGLATIAGVGVGLGAALHAGYASRASEGSAAPVVTAVTTLAAASASPFAPVPPEAPAPPHAEITPSPAPGAVPKRPARALAATTSSATPVAPPPPPPVAPSVSIAREIALIDGVRSSLAAGSPQGALTKLDAYDVEHRGGALSLEAFVLRIEALAAAGDREGAAARAARFLAEHPQSAYDARVRAHLSNP